MGLEGPVEVALSSRAREAKAVISSSSRESILPWHCSDFALGS
jgi:hypothetical protein